MGYPSFNLNNLHKLSSLTNLSISHLRLENNIHYEWKLKYLYIENIEFDVFYNSWFCWFVYIFIYTFFYLFENIQSECECFYFYHSINLQCTFSITDSFLIYFDLISLFSFKLLRYGFIFIFIIIKLNMPHVMHIYIHKIFESSQ